MGARRFHLRTSYLLEKARQGRHGSQFQVCKLQPDLEFAIAENAVLGTGLRMDGHDLAVDQQVEAQLRALPDRDRLRHVDADAVGADVGGAPRSWGAALEGEHGAGFQDLAG
jgi:hypothetical protein